MWLCRSAKKHRDREYKSPLPPPPPPPPTHTYKHTHFISNCARGVLSLEKHYYWAKTFSPTGPFFMIFGTPKLIILIKCLNYIILCYIQVEIIFHFSKCFGKSGGLRFAVLPCAFKKLTARAELGTFGIFEFFH